MLAILQKGEGRTYHDIAKEHGVSSRYLQRGSLHTFKKGLVGIKIKKPGAVKSRITDRDEAVLLSALFNNPHIFGYLRNTWSLRSLARCLTDELDITISFKHLQRITKDMGIRCTRPKLELLHGEDYEQGKKRVDNYKHVASTMQKRDIWITFEDETTITQKPCIHKSMSFEGQQLRIEHNGSRRKFSAYISMLWPEEKLMTYDFYDDRMNSTNTIDHLENLKRNIMKSDWWKRLILIWDNASYHVSLMVRNYINAQKEEDWLTIIHLPKKAPYLNPNERKVNQQIKSDVWE